MKQFILKNIVLVAILVLTLIGSIVLLFFCEGKRRTIAQSMAEIDENVQKIEAIDSARKPNSVTESETRIKADTETLNKKNVQIYRHFGKPYRPALLIRATCSRMTWMVVVSVEKTELRPWASCAGSPV